MLNKVQYIVGKNPVFFFWRIICQYDVKMHIRSPKFQNAIVLQLSEKYGGVFTIHFGPEKIVVLAGYSAVKDALVNQPDDFGERAHVPVFKLICKDKGLLREIHFCIFFFLKGSWFI